MWAMRIGVDYTAAVQQGGGIGRYTRNLIRTLTELDRQNEYRLFVAGGWGEGDGLGAWSENVRIRSLPVSDRWLNVLWQRLRLPVPVQVITGTLDLFHSPDFVLPPTGRIPTILTVHDLSFLRVPEFFVPGFREYLERAVTHAAVRAQHILADSKSTGRDLVELLGVEEQRVSVVYPGVETEFRPISNAEELKRVRDRYHLPPRFVLGLSTLQPRKNFEGLIKAFGHLMDSKGTQPEFRDLHLVIAGGKGWMYEELLALPEEMGLSERVHFPGFVEDDALPALYTQADVFAFPSWYEGFGIPVLEAMACQTPVVAADNSSLPEAVGDAGLMVDAADIDGLTQALGRAIEDVALRERLVAAGQEQVRRFSWKASAQRLLNIYGIVGGVGIDQNEPDRIQEGLKS
jgi:glycosyltransferase involved in cell wall biosynthesis